VTSVSNNLGELVYNTEYSDITLVVEDVRFQSHKVILAARSDYFWENCISLDFYFLGLSGPRNQRKLEPHN
jgi:hypothetical protein